MTTTGDTATAEATKDATVNSADAAAAEAAASPKKEPAPPKPSVHKQDFEKDVVYLYQFPRAPTIPSLSAFCLKVETFLRVTGIKYENIDAKLFKFRSKKGQLPFIELNGEEIADSDIILKELSKKFEKNLDNGLTTEQKVQSHAFESMLNNHTGWVVRLWRYSHPDDFLAASQLDVKRALNSKLPKGVLEFMFKWGIKRNVSDAIGHGIGHHSLEEAVEFGKSDLLTLSQFLGSKDYFFGKQIRQLDVVAFAHISQFIYVPFSGLKEWIEKETPNLISFVERIKNKYWSDWDSITSTLSLNTHLPKKELTAEQIEEQKKAEEKKAEEARKKEEKKKEKVRKGEEKKAAREAAREAKKAQKAQKSKGEGESATQPAADEPKDPSVNPSVATTSGAPPDSDPTTSARVTRSSHSFRIPSAFVSITRSLSNVTRKTGSYRFSSPPTPEQEEKKKQKEEEKRKAKEEKERKKKEAEEAKAKAAAEKAEKEKAEKEKKEAEAKAAAEAAAATGEGAKTEEPTKEEKKE